MTTLADLVPDPANRRVHSGRNLAMVREALETVGAARSIVIDEDNVILAGNGVTEAATAAGLTKVRIVDAEGDEVVAVRRRGLTEDQKRALALYDNRTGELATWDVNQLQADLAAGLDLVPFFTDAELRALVATNEDVQSTYAPEPSAYRGMKMFVVMVTPEQFQTITTALQAVVEAGHGDGASSQPLANALVYVLERGNVVS